ncbi:MAG: outer membrane lipoprotein-sorting protein [Pseudomonadaceae bacterium]|nr:outer membrane lipoprotein-sorting protein [Pseudomonadaceae bacterium]
MNQTTAFYNFYDRLTQRPWITVSLGLLFIIIAGSGLTRLVKDTSIDAFVPAGHESLLANERTKTLFGLTEPIAVAVFTRNGETVFSTQTLAVVEQITEALGEIDNIDPQRIASISSESSIVGVDGSILVDPYFDPDVGNSIIVEAAARRWRNMPPHIDTLVSADEQAAVIMAEVIDPRAASTTYLEVQQLIESLDHPELDFYIAGPAAVSGYLSDYIDADARVLQPVVFLIVIIFLYFAFMRASALLGPIIVLLGAAGGSLGIMAWQGVPYFAITNALPVILVAISVADAIHILSAYFERRARLPDTDPRLIVIDAMLAMARPITLTTLTTIAGFTGIAVVSIMPPIAYFAWYAMLGVALAWVFSIFVLPAVLTLLQPRPSPLFSDFGLKGPDFIGVWLGNISLLGARFPAAILGGFALLIMVAAMGALELRVDRSQVNNFAPDEPIRIADERIHNTFAGTAFLDVIISTEEVDGLLNAQRMKKIADLQTWLEDHEHVSKTVSIADYLTLLHSAVNNQAVTANRTLPSTDDAIAQYLMVYEASGDPSDLEEEITPDYDAALLRAVLNSHYFSDSREVVLELQDYLANEFIEPGMQATIAGDVNVAFHWMTRLQESHFTGVALSLLLVLIMSVCVFRSLSVGFIAVIPVTFTVLCIYGVMGALDIYLEPATSMFAAISVGVGVDFAIHLVDRLQYEMRTSRNKGQNTSAIEIISRVVPSTARACFFNAAALGVGFSVLMISDLPTLQRFGGLVTVAAMASFLSALIIVPACYVMRERLQQVRVVPAIRTVGSLSLVAIASLVYSPDGEAFTAQEVAAAVANRTEAEQTTRTIQMTLTDKRGRVRQRQAVVFRAAGEDTKLTRITYLEPKRVRELTFLSRDHQDLDKSDERWLYIPAAGKTRRIPASDRGDYFLGTDFTFEDMQSDFKFNLADYNFVLLGSEQVDEDMVYIIQGEPVDTSTAKQLGYGGFTARINASTWFPEQIDFVNPKNKALKTIKIDGLRLIDGIWTPSSVQATHHITGHTTQFDYIDINHNIDAAVDVFAPANLTRGLPASW